MTTFYNHRNQNNTSDTPNSQQINYQFNENLDININTNTNEDYNLYNKIHNSQQNISVPLDNNTNNNNNTINDTNIENSNSNPFDESVVDSNNFTQETITKQEYEDCSLCLDELIEEVAILTCKHEYHLNCFMCWVSKCNTDRKDITCPQCMRNNCEIVFIVNKNNVYSYQNEYYSNYNKGQLTEQQSNISYIMEYNQQYRAYNNTDNNLLNNTSNIQQQSRKSIWKRFISFISCKKI